MANNVTLLFSEVLDKVHKAKTKSEKIAILVINDNSSLRMVLKSSKISPSNSFGILSKLISLSFL